VTAKLTELAIGEKAKPSGQRWPPDTSLTRLQKQASPRSSAIPVPPHFHPPRYSPRRLS